MDELVLGVNFEFIAILSSLICCYDRIEAYRKKSCMIHTAIMILTSLMALTMPAASFVGSATMKYSDFPTLK